MEKSEKIEKLARMPESLLSLFLIGTEILFWFVCLLATAGIVLTITLYLKWKIILYSDIILLCMLIGLLMMGAILLRRKVKEKLMGAKGDENGNVIE